MRRITAFVGSPRKNGNTANIVKGLVEGIESEEVSAEIINLSDIKISGCQGCLSCSGSDKCVIADDMSLLYPKIEQSDGFIFASPTYHYNLTADMKALIDRMFCYYQFTKEGWTSLLGTQKKAIVVGVCAGEAGITDNPTEDTMGFTIPGMRKPLEDLGVKVVREIRYYNTRKEPVIRNEAFQKELIQLGTEFGRQLKNL